LQALADFFLPELSVLHFDTRRIFLQERLRRLRLLFLVLGLRLTRRIFLPLRERRRERFTFLQ
jgi:hypothetical protein